jgi:hypothetical protein
MYPEDPESSLSYRTTEHSISPQYEKHRLDQSGSVQSIGRFEVTSAEGIGRYDSKGRESVSHTIRGEPKRWDTSEDKM